MKSDSPIILITGGSRGIGKNLIDFFKNKDWFVIACSSSSDWVSNSKADFTFTCDIKDKHQIKINLEKIVNNFGKFDVLINNAAIAGKNFLEPDIPDDLWHEIIDTNLHGTYYMSKYSLPYIKNSSGRIINISSVLGLFGVSDQSAYSVSKHAIIGLTKCLALYAAPRNITVNSICPGWVETEMMQERIKSLQLKKTDIKKSLPLSKIIQPNEISSLAYYLTSHEASNLTGQAITLDGGQTLNLS